MYVSSACLLFCPITHQLWLYTKRAHLLFCAGTAQASHIDVVEKAAKGVRPRSRRTFDVRTSRHMCKTVSTRMFTGLRLLFRTTVETCRQGESPAVELRW